MKQKFLFLCILVIGILIFATPGSAAVKMKSCSAWLESNSSYSKGRAYGSWSIDYCHYEYYRDHIVRGQQELVLEPGATSYVYTEQHGYTASLSGQAYVDVSNGNYTMLRARHIERLRCTNCNSTAGRYNEYHYYKY